MATDLTTLDESIASAKHMLDQARRDGNADDIAAWVRHMDARLDRKLAQLRAANICGKTEPRG